MAKYDYSKINYTAQKVLVEKCNVTFPVNILDLISLFPNINISTYNEFNETIAQNFGKRAEQISDEAFSAKVSTDSYIIFYNDDTSLKIPQRIRFTLGHELGHILLGHFDNYEGFLPRNGFGVVNSEIEGEADVFASEILCPTCLTSIKWSQEYVEKLFDVSGSVAKYTIETKKEYPWIKASYTFQKYFSTINSSHRKNFFDETARDESDYNSWYKIGAAYYYHFCLNCKSFEINIEKELNYCGICGSDNLKVVNKHNYFQFHETDEQNVKFFPRGDNNEMNYRILELDNEGRLAQPCPKCGNEHPSSNFCSVCGSEIINKCTGRLERRSGFIVPSEPCNMPLKGHERYCPECGANSTFLENGLLPAWNEENNIENSRFNSPRFTDLPFD